MAFLKQACRHGSAHQAILAHKLTRLSSAACAESDIPGVRYSWKTASSSAGMQSLAAASCFCSCMHLMR